MGYCLLTGATGLVGGYLLKYLQDEQVPVAVLVRPTKLESAAQRIDAVLRRWEAIEGRSLPRPVILSGTMNEDQLGLDASDQQWVRQYCDSILHNAASMTFREDEKTHEPFRTNVDGVGRVLAFCRDMGIRNMHHVSTAYICGLRTGRVLETEIDLGQENGNVYEKSKITGEQMVRAADCLDRPTIYRPASVIGDSASGYTTSAHGFYLPLQLAYVISDKVPTDVMGERFFKLLGLSGDEGKNLVPVDWLARAIVELFTHPEHHGQTYHLSNPQPVTVRMIQEVIQNAIDQYSKRKPAEPLTEEELLSLEALFEQYMDIYRSHWRDDPIFDRTNTDRALPHLPCPAVDRDMLLRVSAYPVQKNFAFREPPEAASEKSARAHLNALIQTTNGAATDPSTTAVGLQVNGRGGGQWQLWVQGTRVVGASEGLGPDTSACMYLNEETFDALADGRLTVDQSIACGRVMIETGGTPTERLAQTLHHVTHPA